MNDGMIPIDGPPPDFHNQYVTLKFSLVPGAVADLEVISAATFHWTQMVKEAAILIDPMSDFKIGISTIDDGSVDINAIFSWAQKKFDATEGVISRYPHIIAIVALASGHLLFADADEVVNNIQITNEIHIEDEYRSELDRLIEKLMNDDSLRRKKEDFFREAYRDKNITEVRVLDSRSGDTIVETTSALELEESYTTSVAIQGSREERTYRTTETVTLIRPTLTKEPDVWTFRRDDGSSVRAYMYDMNFLEKLQQGLYHQVLKTGIEMTLEFQTREYLDGLKWKLRRKGRTVEKVIEIGSSRKLPHFDND